MKFDQILKQIGEFGPYQKRIYLLVCIPTVFAAFHKLIWVFLGAVPAHRCLIDVDDNVTASYLLPDSNLSSFIPWDSDNKQWSRCDKYAVPISNHSSGAEKEACDSWVYDKSQYISTVVTEFDLVCKSNWRRALVHSLYVFGEFLGCTIMSGLSDRIGRRKVLLITLIGQSASGILAGLIPNYYAFIFFRTLVGMFTQGLILVCYVLALEFVGPSKRAIAGVATNYFFGIGYVLVAGVAYLLREWPYLQICLSIPSLIYVIAVWWIPESARWLISVNKSDEAMVIIRKAAAINKTTLPPVDIEKEEKADLSAYRPSQFFRRPAVIGKILVMCFAWFVNSAVYYGVSLNISNLGGNDYLNFLIAALLEFPACTICILSIQKYGRRLPLCITMVIAGLSLLAVMFIPVDQTALVVTFSMIGKFGITISYAIMYIFAAELYPTQIRNIAVGINSTFARTGSMSSSFIVLLADHWKPLPLIILGALSLSSGLLTLLLPETHKKDLPENFADASQLMLPPPKKNRTLSKDAKSKETLAEAELKPVKS